MCIFCSIVEGSIPAQMILKTDGAVAFLDADPRAPGHALIVPQKHIETIDMLSNEDVEKVFLAVRETVKLLARALMSDGFTIGINHGKASGQAVEHMHVHVIPRWKNDGGGSIHAVVENKQSMSVEDVAKKIKEQK